MRQTVYAAGQRRERATCRHAVLIVHQRAHQGPRTRRKQLGIGTQRNRGARSVRAARNRSHRLLALSPGGQRGQRLHSLIVLVRLRLAHAQTQVHAAGGQLLQPLIANGILSRAVRRVQANRKPRALPANRQGGLCGGGKTFGSVNRQNQRGILGHLGVALRQPRGNVDARQRQTR